MYFVTVFFTALRKANGIQTNAGHDNTKRVLTTSLACTFFNTLCLSENKKINVYIATIYSKANNYENYHLMTRVLQKTRETIFASPSASQTCGLTR